MPMQMCPSGKHFFNIDIHVECPSCQQDAPLLQPKSAIDITESEVSDAMQPTVMVNNKEPTPQGDANMQQPPKTTPVMKPTPAGVEKTTPAAATGPKTTIITGVNKLSPVTNNQQVVNLPVVGWLVVTKGPGAGQDFRLVQGENRIGSAADNEVCLNFGDDTISRDAHATIVFDHHANEFFMERGKSRNLAQLNEKTVRGEPNIVAGDRIQLGETELLFVPFCGVHHTW